MPKSNLYLRLFVEYLSPLRTRTLLLVLLIFTTIGLQVLNPQIIRYFIDAAVSVGTSDGRTANLAAAALLFLGGSLVLQALSVISIYVSEDVGWRATNKLREDLTRHCLKLDMTFHHRHKPGEMIERIDGDVAAIAIFFSQFVIRIVGNLLLVIGILIVLLWTDWRISAALLVYTVVALFVILRMRRLAIPREVAAQETNSQLFGFLEEYISGTEDIRASGAVPFVLRKLFTYSRDRLDANYRSAMVHVVMGNLWNFFYTLGHIVALAAGFLLFRQNMLTIGSVYLVIHYTDMILNPLDQITQQVQTFQKAAAGMERVYQLRDRQSTIAPSTLNNPTRSDDQKLGIGPIGVGFENVTFGYRPEEPVLQNISFTLPAGHVLGLLGRTGSGKTTLTRLLYRLYEPQEGTLWFTPSTETTGWVGDMKKGDGEKRQASILKADRINANTLSLDVLRSRIGIVTQDVQLFRGTVRDNISLFDPNVTDEQIASVIQELGLAQWIAKLDQGLDTELASGGSNLSAGEGQLLAFARVFLQDPALVILDEASSRLDPVTEGLIEQAVDTLLTNRTGIIVAHRLGTVERADDIMILEDGRIKEMGERTVLIRDTNSQFHSLLQTGLADLLT
ncbi:MAG: ABC transporter ATP-binding protein [Chloroflexota bacterium]